MSMETQNPASLVRVCTISSTDMGGDNQKADSIEWSVYGQDWGPKMSFVEE